MKPVLADYLTAVENARSTDDLQVVIDGVVKSLGFEGFSYHRYKPEQGEIEYVGQWPDEWLQRYDDNHYVDIDPVAERMLRSVTPFTWREAVASRTVNAAERIVIDEARDFGIVEGAEIPIHETGYGVATVSVFSSDSHAFHDAWAQNKHDFHLFCLYFHDKYGSFAQPPVNEPEPNLTKRERECLVLTSRGKTAGEVGTILSISDRTAKQHLESATRKLNSYSKHHAVVKAIMTRLILP